jgi:hypothetical protein
MSAAMTRDELRKRLEPFCRPWGTVHGDLDEIIDAVLGGQTTEAPADAAPDWWDRVMRGLQP